MKWDEYPPLGELADEKDTLAWDRERHGRMADHAAPDDAVRVTRVKDGRREIRYGGVDESPETD